MIVGWELFSGSAVSCFNFLRLICFCLQFNLAINDDPDVSAEAKKVTNGKLPSKESPMCVEISLKTSEVRSFTGVFRVQH